MTSEQGIVGNLGLSRRSTAGIAAMGMLMKLSASESPHTFQAMVMITVLAVAYMIMDEIKDRRHAKQD